jgi:gas vesicle protein
MRAKTGYIVLAASLAMLVLIPSHSIAARSSALKTCSSQWASLKKAGKTEGQTWPEFWSQCSKDFASKHQGAASKKAAAVDESDSSGSGQQKQDCDAKWDSYKTRSGAHGWHDYFRFMAKCM